MYIWTKKAERKSIKQKIRIRQQGAQAFFAGEPIENTPSIRIAWEQKRYIVRA